MSALQITAPDLVALDDQTFRARWAVMTPDERHEHPEGFERYRKLTPWVSETSNRLERNQRRNGTHALRLAPVPAAESWPAPMDLAELAACEPQAPQFIVKNWLPVGYVSLIAGHGGVGKSAIALHLATCIALGLPWAGSECKPLRVLYLSCEDRESVLHWRLARICAHLGISMAELAGRLDIVELVAHDSILWERDASTGTAAYTAAYGHLAAQIERSQAEVLIVDGISDTFGGNENARGDVKRYVNALLALVPADRGAVLLLGHVDKATAGNVATAEGYSGSTGWHNTARSRWYLYPETDQGDGRPERTGALRLELQKSNLGPVDQTMTWRWNEEAHMFLPDAPPSYLDHARQQREEQRGILLAFKSCVEADITVPTAMQGPRTVYLVLSQRPEFPASLKGRDRAKNGRFRAHIEQLRQIRRIEVCEIRRTNRHPTEVFRITAEGLRQCA